MDVLPANRYLFIYFIYLFYYSICISLSLSSVSRRMREYLEEKVEVLQSRKDDHFPNGGVRVVSQLVSRETLKIWGYTSLFSLC